MLKRWRRRVRGRLTLFTGLLVLGIVLPMHIAAAFDRSAVYWAGLSTGAVMTMVLSNPGVTPRLHPALAARRLGRAGHGQGPAPA